MDKDIVYVVEDDMDLAEILTFNLESEGFEVKHFTNGNEFFKTMEQTIPNIIILDIMLPGYDGVRIAKILRQNVLYKDIPIIFLTAKSEEEDKIEGFNAGADDYITKPFSSKELIARIRAVLNRYKKTNPINKLKIEDLEIDDDKMEVMLRGKPISLTKTEFRILKHLVENIDKILSRDKIINIMWSYGTDINDRTVDVHIKHLRDKLLDYGKYIKTIRGVGYKFSLKDE
jgi:Response regulators consisting of a CheY-like receiver domain and a winged-helix DNA-binding domain